LADWIVLWEQYIPDHQFLVVEKAKYGTDKTTKIVDKMEEKSNKLWRKMEKKLKGM
jgi:hypothetical protein